ncbi:MAG: hypothetical protein LBM93_03280 [Oscillospiraceae bacterium]|nr:hypothetical protein [Oscillospiraceae bacterium]
MKFDEDAMRKISIDMLEDTLRKTFFKGTYDKYYNEVSDIIYRETGQRPSHKHIVETLVAYVTGDTYKPE